jgi:manganese efflux pump family protein
MTPAAILILSLSMSADAFAAAVGRGAAHRPSPAQAVKAGLVFGVIEATTPLIGWGLGRLAADFVERIDHWLAFGLLCIVGLHMIRESFATEDEATNDSGDGAAQTRKSGPWTLIATAIGTSIDAAAIGVGLAFADITATGPWGSNIWVIAAAIGLTTFACTTTGMLIGKRIGARFGKLAERVGGVALIVLGTLILLEHLGMMNT